MTAGQRYKQLLDDAWQRHTAPRSADAPTVVSTFAGGGGSSLGYSVAGYRELLASDFDPHACETLRLNFTDTQVVEGDIAQLTTDAVLSRCNLQVGQLDVLDGSPPCQGFSMTGRRDPNDPRSRLFVEYCRLLAGLQPKLFVMENVPGLAAGVMRTTFAEIVQTLKDCGYVVSVRCLSAQYFGVPQARRRLIFVGTRKDLGIQPSHPTAQTKPFTASQAVEYKLNNDQEELAMLREAGERMATYKDWHRIAVGRSRISLGESGWNCVRIHPDRPASTITKNAGENWGNRPSNSLTTILLPWFPQTLAAVAQRQRAVAALLNEIPEVGWKLLMAILPSHHGVSSGSHKPAWRQMIPDDWSGGVSHKVYWEQVIAYSELAVNEAMRDRSKLADLVNRLDQIPSPPRGQLLEYLRSDVITAMLEGERLSLWTALVEIITKHRKFKDAEWAMTPQMTDEIAAVAERLSPVSPAYRHKRLFSEREFDLLEETDNYEQQIQKIEERRQQAVREILTVGGVAAVLDFSQSVESPWRVGCACGQVAGDDAQEAILPSLLITEVKTLAHLAGGFVWGRLRARSWQWVDGLDISAWPPAQRGQFLAYLPFCCETWERATRLLGADESSYWSRTRANPYEASESLEYAIDHLVQYGRPWQAVQCLEAQLHKKLPMNAQQAIQTLNTALSSTEEAHSMDWHAVTEIIGALQKDTTANPEDILHLEWAYLPCLDRLTQGGCPVFLEQKLADQPAFFCEVIQIVFRSKKETAPPPEPMEQQKNKASNAYRLLSQWRTPPGKRMDKTYDGNALAAWLEEVKARCAESGHLEVALTMVGHALIHAPPDPDGLWLHRSVAKALNEPDAGDMRNGFRTELYNSRGVHSWTAGKEERELAAKYRKQAEDMEGAGFHRFATTLREFATSYEREADFNANRDPFEV